MERASLPSSSTTSSSADGSRPVEAHRYDLFEYYDDLVGSAHHASKGILFMTYYFEQIEDAGREGLVGQGTVEDRVGQLLDQLPRRLLRGRRVVDVHQRGLQPVHPL